MGLDLDWVTPRLAMGGRFETEAALELAGQLAIRRVVDLRLECRDDEAVLARHGVVLLHLPTEDQCAIAPEMIGEGVRWVNAQLAAGHKVYIHCEHGIGRSALLTLCVLVSRAHPPLAALARLKAARACVSPSPAQLEAFVSWCQEWRHAHQPAWATPSLDELAQVAYRLR